MPTMSITTSYSIGSGGKTYVVSKTSGADATISEDIADGSTNTLVACAFDYTKVVMCYVVSTVDMTLKTNSSGSPTQTIALKAGVPLAWNDSQPTSLRVFTANVTALYLTNASGDDGTFTLAVLVDPT